MERIVNRGQISILPICVTEQLQGFKYFDLRETSKVRINIKGKATGIVYVSTEEGGKPVAKIQVKPCKEQHGFAADVNGTR